MTTTKENKDKMLAGRKEGVTAISAIQGTTRPLDSVQREERKRGESLQLDVRNTVSECCSSHDSNPGEFENMTSLCHKICFHSYNNMDTICIFFNFQN